MRLCASCPQGAVSHCIACDRTVCQSVTWQFSWLFSGCYCPQQLQCHVRQGNELGNSVAKYRRGSLIQAFKRHLLFNAFFTNAHVCTCLYFVCLFSRFISKAIKHISVQLYCIRGILKSLAINTLRMSQVLCNTTQHTQRFHKEVQHYFLFQS